MSTGVRTKRRAIAVQVLAYLKVRGHWALGLPWTRMQKLGRRALLISGSVVAAATLVGLAGCKKRRLNCTTLRGVSDLHRRRRLFQAYTDRSRISDRNCKNCSLYIAAPNERTCGGCTLFRGPVHPRGWCKGWKS